MALLIMVPLKGLSLSNKDKNMAYSIWIIPSEANVRSYVTTVVTDLAQKFNGPIFEPHTTVLGDVHASIEEMEGNCKKIASQTKPFIVETGAVEYSTTYYQCAFVRLKSNPELMTLYDTTKAVFGMSAPTVYMPHMSLFYGNVSYETRQEIIDSLSFTPQQFLINSLVVTPGGELPPSEWQHLMELPLIG